MKIVAKCLAFVSLTYQAHAKICNPIPLNALFLFLKRKIYIRKKFE